MQKGRTRNSRGGFRGRGRGRGGGGGSGTSTRLKGLFDNGIWYCDCIPRQPAEHFRVKKEGPNKDRWFYTCPSDGDKRCGFFLWDEAAKLRESAAVLNNSRSEPRDPNVQEGWNAGRDAQGKMVSFSSSAKDASPTPTAIPSYPTLPAAPSGTKRNVRQAQFDDDEEEDEFDLNGQDEEEIFKAVDMSSFETPNKAQKTGVYATPAASGKKSPRRLPWLQQQQMPATPVSNKKTAVDYFNTSPSKQPNTETTGAHVSHPRTPAVPSTLPAPPDSPSPSRFKDALRNPADSQSSLTNEVLLELASIKLPPEKLDSLRSILSKHDLRTQGVTKGRDISRLALKAKEAKIVEFEARIASLQAEKEVDRSVIARLRWRQENGGNEDDEETDDEL